MYLNMCLMGGTIAGEPVLRFYDKGAPVVFFDLMLQSPTTRKKNYLPCVAFGKNAELIVKYYADGDEIVIEAEALVKSFTNQEGKRGSKVNFNINRIHKPKPNLRRKKAQEEKKGEKE